MMVETLLFGYKLCGSTFVSSAPQCAEEHGCALFEGFQVSPTCLSDKSSIKMKMIMER